LRVAAHAFIRQVCLRDGATHYQVLCVGEDARPESIKENYHLLIALIHPDRQDPNGEPWPRGSAPRVNEAYAVLSDAVRRGEYDEGLKRVTTAARSFVPQWESRAGDPAHGGFALLRRPVAVVGLVTVSLLALQAWWLADAPHAYSTIERAPGLSLSSQLISDAAAPGKPRFLEAVGAATVPSPAERLQTRTDGTPALLSPLWSALGNSGTPKERKPPAIARVVMPARAPAKAEDDAPVVLPAPHPVTEQVALAPSVASRPIGVSQAEQSTPPPAAPQAPPVRAVASEEIEKVVVRLIGAYEAGDADRLMELMDRGELGFWESLRVHETFAAFFSATRTRRLQLERMAWRESAGVARAQGEATLIADYLDGSPSSTRKIPVEMDFAMRDGKARITRLALFPNAK
jgi:curved DNA-binding protein CbpA